VIPPKLHSILEELKSIEDYQTRMDFLIEFGESFKEVPPEIAQRPFSELNKVPACESDAYVFTTKNENGTLNLYFAVENPHGISAKAMAKILDEGLEGETPESIAQVPEEIVYDIFGKDLSMGKGLGLMGMIRQVKFLANKNI
jgi:cysteine desulfuration protein SufE